MVRLPVYAGAVALAAALSQSPAAHADTPCTVAGGTETCTGDQSDGVVAVPGISVLNVNSLTTAIAPPAGTNGITFQKVAGGNVSINSNVAPFGIVAQSSSSGIRASSQNMISGSSGTVSVSNVGDIRSGAFGIDARSVASANTGSVEVSNRGNISSNVGIQAFSAAGGFEDAGDVTVNSAGQITATSTGIQAFSTAFFGNTGKVSVTSFGDISAVTGISAGSSSAAVNVFSSGNVSGSDRGIQVFSNSIGNLELLQDRSH